MPLSERKLLPLGFSIIQQSAKGLQHVRCVRLCVRV